MKWMLEVAGMMDQGLRVGGIIFACLLVFAAFIHALALVAVLMIWPVNAYECREQTESFRHRYLVISTQCQVRVDGKWINWDRYTAVYLEAKE